jgi:hypothetical protein
VTFAQALELLDDNQFNLLSHPESGIQGVAVGRKGGGPIAEAGPDQFVIVAYVPNKLSTSELHKLKILTGPRLFSKGAGKAAPALKPDDIDVVECGEPFTVHAAGPGLSVPAAHRGLYGGRPPVLDAQKWFSTLRMGISITNPEDDYPQRLSVGTLGFFLEDANNQRYLVSNNHVIGRSNAAQPGEPVVQPGTLDMTATELQLMPTLNDLKVNWQVAAFTAAVTIRFETKRSVPKNRVDAAMAQLSGNRNRPEDHNRLAYGGSILGVAAPYQVDANGRLTGSTRVYKVGRTTGYTEGVVTAVAAATNIHGYPGGSAYFVDQVVVEATADNIGPFSDRGDSGSAVLIDRHQLIGLLFGGSSLQTFVNPIAVVLRGLEKASSLTGLRVVHL